LQRRRRWRPEIELSWPSFGQRSGQPLVHCAPQREPASPSPQWQAKVKNRPVPQLASDSQPPAVGFYDGFADCQSHAGSVDLHALVSSAIKFFEDEGLLEVVDARTSISNAGDECFVLGFCSDADRRTGG